MNANANKNVSGLDMRALLDRLRAKIPVTTEELKESAIVPVEEPLEELIPEIGESTDSTDKYGQSITYNSNQQRAVDIGGSGKSLVIIGAAGTGKTTCQKGLVSALIQNDLAGILDAGSHSHLTSKTPGIVVCAYTRRAVQNIRRNMPKDMQGNCITIHKLLEYQPVYDEYCDAEGNWKKKMSFQPMRGPGNPLPRSIHTIIFEESSMLSLDLYNEVKSAFEHPVQEVFLGDIQQLPPVFGPAILGFKLLELPVIELTEVYRQALESPIIRLAHRVLSGKAIPKEEFPEWDFPGQLKIHPWKKKLHWEHALPAMGTFLTQAIDIGEYDPEEDIVLCPFNKSFGTDELNRKIANHLARKREVMTYEIIAGFAKIYLSPGDKVLFDKEDATILEITSNPGYAGKTPIPASLTLDYWGGDSALGSGAYKSDTDDFDMDAMLALAAAQGGNSGADGEERKRQASHIIKLQMNDSDRIVDIQNVGDINLLGLGYALTVHKSQGSEWRKVFFLLHNSHATMVQRELLYTGFTRPREFLYIVCEPDSLINGIRSQRVKGDTLEEKAEFFKGKLKEIKE